MKTKTALWSAILIGIQLGTLSPLQASECEIKPFNAPRAHQIRLDSGIVGRWDQTMEETMIYFTDEQGAEQAFYSVQKQPADGSAESLILFLHGFPEFAMAWEKELLKFGETQHAVAIDIKGHHYSARPSDVAEYDFVRAAAEIRSIIECLGYEKATIVGHDFGGAIAWLTGMTQPEVVDKLIILNAPHPYLFGRALLDPEGDQAERSVYIGYATGDTISSHIQFFLFLANDMSILRSPFYNGIRFFRLLSENWLPLSRWKTMTNYYRSIPNISESDVYPEVLSDELRQFYTVEAPTLVLWGLADPYFSHDVLNGMDELVPQLELHTFEQATHWINHELDDLGDRIEQFIEESSR